MPAKVRLFRSSKSALFKVENRFSHIGNHILGNVSQFGVCFALFGVACGNGVKILAGLEFLPCRLRRFFILKNHLQHGSSFRRYKLGNVFIKILLYFFFARIDFPGRVFNGEAQKRNVALFRFNKLVGKIVVILLQLVLRDLAVDFHVLGINDNVFEHFFLIVDFVDVFRHKLGNVNHQRRILNQMLFNNVAFQRIDVHFFRPAGGAQRLLHQRRVKVSFCVAKVGHAADNLLDQSETDFNVVVFGGFFQNGVGKFFLNNVLQQGVAHIVVNFKIFAEHFVRSLNLPVQFLGNLILSNDNVINLDNRFVLGGASEIARNAEQRHETECRQDQNAFHKP